MRGLPENGNLITRMIGAGIEARLPRPLGAAGFDRRPSLGDKMHDAGALLAGKKRVDKKWLTRIH
jgi:hypothetical protein